MALRRQFDLCPPTGNSWMNTACRGKRSWTVPQWVLIQDFPTHDGYNHPRVTAAIRMETGYPNTELNMVYFFPALARKDGRRIGATSATQALDGKSLSALVAPSHRAKSLENWAR